MIGRLIFTKRSIYALAAHHDLRESIGAILGRIWGACFLLPAGGFGSADESLRAAGRCSKEMRRFR
jgi:hypothetical protein